MSDIAKESAPRYHRIRREGRLGFRLKFAQGLGAIPDTIKGWAFNTFVLLFYNQILGVEPLMVSVALAIAIVFDAVTDPIVASLSDNLSTRWGRRHPLMLIASMPLGLCLYCVFVPPAGLSQIGLFTWLLTFVVLTRGFMTLYFVPWVAIAAELSDDYHERTSVMAYRYAVGWFIAVTFPLFTFTFIMPSTPEFPVGQLNPEGYPTMALCAGILLSGAALITTLLTLKQVPYLRQHTQSMGGFSFIRTGKELWRALQNRQFALIFLIVLLASAILGTTGNIYIYMTTYFWGLNTSDLRWFALSSVGAIIAFPLVAGIQRRWDKKYILLACSITSLFEGITIVSLRFLDILPENGDPWLLVILVANGVLGAGVGVVHGIIGSSIVADILDDHELRTGYRQEAMFNAALSFSSKAISGVGIVLGGLILTLIDFPVHANPSTVSPDMILRLGVTVGFCVPLLHLIPISLITRYKITREEHAKIQAALAEKNAALEESEVSATAAAEVASGQV